MTRLVKVGSAGDEVEWKEALKNIQPDDVLLLEPGYYQIEPGFNVVDLTIKGTGSSPEDTVIEGYFVLGEDCSFFTLENIALNTKTKNNAIFVEYAANTYLTMRNAVIHGGNDDTAGIAINGKCTLELFSTKIVGASLSLFESADFRITMNDSLIDYPSDKYAAIGIQGKGTAIISSSKINGSVSTYPGSNSELDINNSQIDKLLVHGSTWMNMINSSILARDDTALYLSDESWANIIRCTFAGGVFVDKKVKLIMQNCRMDRLIVCDQAQITLNNCTILSHADFQDQVKADATRTAFSGGNHFEYFLALNKNAILKGKDLILNPNGSLMAVHDNSRIKLKVLSASQESIDIEGLSESNIDIIGLKWKIKKND
ncbi:hypothetical protein [Lactobacillus sp. PV034]|uniref:hypothetical protein n=1 Tax=Lactobacillus sp. PV034 TaxID=2594495 RepID=UPI00223F84B8|nr:hypothetical protein [Lactobacillus sp. PV034]QNQ80902.1 hypothetical protein FP432_04685 [Lactobacillus sp. PV034]